MMKKILFFILIPFACFGQTYLEPDAIKNFNAITIGGDVFDGNSYGALNLLIIDLKGGVSSGGVTFTNTWQSDSAIYPMLLNTATAHAFNIKKASTSVYGMSFFGSPTHSSNGVLFNGTSQYARTGINASLLNKSNGFTIYVNGGTIGTGAPYLFGQQGSPDFNNRELGASVRTTTVFYTSGGEAHNSIGETSLIPTIPFTLSGDCDGINIYMYLNGVSKASASYTSTSVVYDTVQLILGGLNQTSTTNAVLPNSYYNETVGTFILNGSIGTTGIVSQYNAVKAFNQLLGR